MYKEISRINKEGWTQKAYQAWINKFGSPKEHAKQLKRNPEKALEPLEECLGDVRGKRIINLLGSHGSKAVAMAILGADVTVVDISSENARYANELAHEAGIEIRYIVSDVMDLSEQEQISNYDTVFMELGILHWIMDLGAFFQIVSRLLHNGGKLILRDFHPYKRLLHWENGLMIANGNYFDNSILEGDVAYVQLLSEDDKANVRKIRTRGWTMGQVVTAIANAGLIVQSLTEEQGKLTRWMFPQEAPAGIENRIPSIYTLIAEKG